MKQNLIKDILQEMLPFLNNVQCAKLQEVLHNTFIRYDVVESQQQENNLKRNYLELFLVAKRIEGCSDKSLKYYKATIERMVNTICKRLNIRNKINLVKLQLIIFVVFFQASFLGLKRRIIY